MHAARFPEAHRTAQSGRAGEMHFPRFQNDRFVERPVLMAIALADEAAQQSGFVWNFHASYRLRAAAQRWPAQTAQRHKTTERMTFAAARNQSPSIDRLSVCRLKEEKVVYPPQTPAMKASRHSGL